MKRSICILACVILFMTLFITTSNAVDGKQQIIIPFAAGAAAGEVISRWSLLLMVSLF